MKAKLIYENLNETNFVSKFRPGMKVRTKDNLYHIEKIEDHSPKFDILHVYDTNEKKRKMISSTFLEREGTIIPNERKKRESEGPLMTSREYEREIKGAVLDIKHSLDDDEIEEKGYDYIVDSADSMLYDESLYNYLYKKYRKLYQETPNRRDLKEMLANDMTKYF